MEGENEGGKEGGGGGEGGEKLFLDAQSGQTNAKIKMLFLTRVI